MVVVRRVLPVLDTRGVGFNLPKRLDLGVANTGEAT